MDPLTVRHKQGKLTLSDDLITIQRVGFPRPTPQEIRFAEILAIHHTMSMPSLLGQGGAMSITLRLAGAPAVDLELVAPASAAQQVVTAVESYLASNPPTLPETATPVTIPSRPL